MFITESALFMKLQSYCLVSISWPSRILSFSSINRTWTVCKTGLKFVLQHETQPPAKHGVWLSLSLTEAWKPSDPPMLQWVLLHLLNVLHGWPPFPWLKPPIAKLQGITCISLSQLSLLPFQITEVTVMIWNQMTGIPGLFSFRQISISRSTSWHVLLIPRHSFMLFPHPVMGMCFCCASDTTCCYSRGNWEPCPFQINRNTHYLWSASN